MVYFSLACTSKYSNTWVLFSLVYNMYQPLSWGRNVSHLKVSRALSFVTYFCIHRESGIERFLCPSSHVDDMRAGLKIPYILQLKFWDSRKKKAQKNQKHRFYNVIRSTVGKQNHTSFNFDSQYFITYFGPSYSVL